MGILSVEYVSKTRHFPSYSPIFKKKKGRQECLEALYNGGETGIRTLGTVASTSVFETDPFDHSGISPR